MGDLLVGPFPRGKGLPGEGPPGEPRLGQPLAGLAPPCGRLHPSPPARAPHWSREQRLWWLLWSRCPGVGWVRIRSLERGCGGLAAAWRTPADELAGLPGWHGGLVPVVERFRQRWGDDPLGAQPPGAEPGLRVMLPGDPHWPVGIESLARPPLALWWQGRGSLWSLVARRRAVAVVGTRRPSPHGLGMARALGQALAEAGWPVISGLAEGIDGAVHSGCLERNGAPIGVLGTSLERIYPQHHASLQRAVGQRGLLLSEQAAGTPVRRGHFAGRNRLLVGMAAAVVVVECPPESGALHSAAYAWEQGLPLWVVPGDAARVSALGSNRLLARGATPLLNPQDLLTSLGPGPLARQAPRSTTAGLNAARRPAGAPARGSGSGPEGLLEAVGLGASLDEICERSGRAAGELALALLELECAGLLRAEPGLRWQPC